MGKCTSCGIEDVPQFFPINVDGWTHYVCLKCYSEIQKNLIEAQRNIQTEDLHGLLNAVIDRLDSLDKLVESISSIQNTHSKHIDTLGESLHLTDEKIDGLEETVRHNARINDQNWATMNEKHYPKWKEMDIRITELSKELQNLKSKIEKHEKNASL